MSHSPATASISRDSRDPVASNRSPDPQPSAWIARWLERLPRGALVLDLAAGSGRHLRLAHSLGLRALGVDRDAEALAAAVAAIDSAGATANVPHADRQVAEAGQVEGRVLDLESGPWTLPGGAFDAVIVANYLFRPRFALICGLLAPGGLLIYETFGLGNEAWGRPSNPSFLLREGELFDRARAAGLTVLGYESGYTDAPKPAIVQRICAARPPLRGERLALG